MQQPGVSTYDKNNMDFNEVTNLISLVPIMPGQAAGENNKNASCVEPDSARLRQSEPDCRPRYHAKSCRQLQLQTQDRPGWLAGWPQPDKAKLMLGARPR